jgi:hypothetical protein
MYEPKNIIVIFDQIKLIKKKRYQILNFVIFVFFLRCPFFLPRIFTNNRVRQIGFNNKNTFVSLFFFR